MNEWLATHLRYRVLLPKESQAPNLLVSAALSASHVGSGPLRLEPQYMNLGQAAGVAAVQVATGRARTVQSVNVTELQATLVAQGVTIRTTTTSSNASGR